MAWALGLAGQETVRGHGARKVVATGLATGGTALRGVATSRAVAVGLAVGMGAALVWHFAQANAIGAAVDATMAGGANGVGAAVALTSATDPLLPVVSGGPLTASGVPFTPPYLLIPNPGEIDALIGSVSCTNTPITAMNIVSGDPYGFFAIYFNTLHLRTSATLSQLLPTGIYLLGINATNSEGTGPTSIIEVDCFFQNVATGTGVGAASAIGSSSRQSIASGIGAAPAIGKGGVVATATGVGVAPAVSGGGDQSAYKTVDGSLNAPTGSPQLPTLLNTYHAGGHGDARVVGTPAWFSGATPNAPFNASYFQPPWYVAGVDYYVGIDRSAFPTNASLTSGSSGGLPSGCVRVGNNITVTPTGGNTITLNGYDFTNIQIIFANNNTGNLVISNCFWQVGSNNGTGSNGCISDSGTGGGTVTVKYCEVDGNGAAMNSNFTFANNSGILFLFHRTNAIFEWCYFHDCYCDGVRMDINGSRHESLTIQYCLHVNNSFNTACHADWLQVNCAEPNDSSVDNAVIQYNTYYQTNAGLNNANSFFRFNTQCNSPTAQNNTCLVASNAQVDTMCEFVEDITDSPSQIVNGILRYNYVQPDNFGHNAIATNPTGGYSASNIQVAQTGNINVNTGATITG